MQCSDFSNRYMAIASAFFGLKNENMQHISFDRFTQAYTSLQAKTSCLSTKTLPFTPEKKNCLPRISKRFPPQQNHKWMDFQANTTGHPPGVD